MPCSPWDQLWGSPRALGTFWCLSAPVSVLSLPSAPEVSVLSLFSHCSCCCDQHSLGTAPAPSTFLSPSAVPAFPSWQQKIERPNRKQLLAVQSPPQPLQELEMEQGEVGVVLWWDGEHGAVLGSGCRCKPTEHGSARGWKVLRQCLQPEGRGNISPSSHK